MINPGKYLAVAKGSDILTAKSGNKQVIVDFEIVEGEYTGQRIYWSGTFTEKAAKKAKNSSTCACAGSGSLCQARMSKLPPDWM